MKLPLPSEHQIQTDIMTFLILKGWYVMRLNSGIIPSATKGKMIRLMPAGTPDIMAFKNIVTQASSVHHLMTNQLDLIFIEVKKEGKKATPIQEETMRSLEKYGARCLVAHSVAEVEKFL